MRLPTIDQFPLFLQSYGNLVDHLNSQLDDLTSKGKGDIFARFTSKIIPLTEVGLKSEFDADDIKIRQHSHDEGVDIECINNDRSRILYVQSKLTLRNASEFDTIISKFENYQRKFHPDSQIFQPLLLGNYSGLLPTCQRKGNRLKYTHDERRRTASSARRESHPQSIGS
jgi:hypothetical protein